MSTTMKGNEIDETIRRSWPQLRENLLRMAELDEKLKAAGIPVPPMPPILQEALRIARSVPLSNRG